MSLYKFIEDIETKNQEEKLLINISRLNLLLNAHIHYLNLQNQYNDLWLVSPPFFSKFLLFACVSFEVLKSDHKES